MWPWRAAAAVGAGTAAIAIYLIVLGRFRTGPAELADALGARFVVPLWVGFIVLAVLSDLFGQAFMRARFDPSGPAIAFRALFSAALIGVFSGYQESGLTRITLVAMSPDGAAAGVETGDGDGRQGFAVDGFVLHRGPDGWLLLSVEDRNVVRVNPAGMGIVEGG